MPLPVLNVPNRRSDADLLRLFCRTEALLADPLGETTPLQSGSALTNPGLAEIAAANRMLDAAIPAGWSAEQAIAEVNAHFANRGVRCLEWWPNSAQPSAPLADGLRAAGFLRQRIEVLVLPSPRPPAGLIGPELSIYSARAGVRHARALVEEMAADRSHPDQHVEAMLLHLDNPHYELLLATESGEPIGTIGVLSAGDLGRIEPIFVRPAHRCRGIEALLLSRAIELCVRSRFADVLVAAPAIPPDSQDFYAAAGFRPIGDLVVHKQSAAI